MGLRFGAEFIPIYQRHPNANLHTICQRTWDKVDATRVPFGVERRCADFDALLREPEIAAVHINSPIPDHGWKSIAALKPDKHVARTVPMPSLLSRVDVLFSTQRRLPTAAAQSLG